MTEVIESKRVQQPDTFRITQFYCNAAFKTRKICYSHHGTKEGWPKSQIDRTHVSQ